MRKYSFLFVLVAVSQMGATNCGHVLRDPGFDLWCGEELCAWKLERGDVKRVPTWHEGDAGVSLVGEDVAIEQLAPVNYGDGTCITFDLVANVEETAEVYLNIDVQGDGTNEMHERLPTSHWKPLSYNISIAPPYDGVRFEITKRGAGTAVLANIGANTADAAKCAGLSVLDPGPRRDGAACTMASDCASATCAASPTPMPDPGWLDLACTGCTAGTCGAGQVCGLGDAFSPVFAVPVMCVAIASKDLGEACLDSAECASGGCFRIGNGAGVCSTCFNDSSCPQGQTCAASYAGGPLVCGGGQHLVASGAVCGSDNDCASGSCVGPERMECEDGRECHSPADCPFGVGDKALQNGACTTVGIQGGTCQ